MLIAKVLDIREGLKALVECDSPKALNLTGKERYDIWRALRKAKKATEDYDKARDGLITQFGKKEDNGSFSVPRTLPGDEGNQPRPNPNYYKFIEEEKKLREIEVEFTPVTFPADTFQPSPQVSLGLIDVLVTVGVLTE